jgi:hypothetical protein
VSHAKQTPITPIPLVEVEGSLARGSMVKPRFATDDRVKQVPAVLLNLVEIANVANGGIETQM